MAEPNKANSPQDEVQFTFLPMAREGRLRIEDDTNDQRQARGDQVYQREEESAKTVLNVDERRAGIDGRSFKDMERTRMYAH